MRNDKISIQSWRRSAEDLAEFVNRIWEHSYAGKMPFPHWTAEHPGACPPTGSRRSRTNRQLSICGFPSFSGRTPGQNLSGTEVSQESEFERSRAGSNALSQVVFESDPGTTCATRCTDIMDTSATHECIFCGDSSRWIAPSDAGSANGSPRVPPDYDAAVRSVVAALFDSESGLGISCIRCMNPR